MIFLIEVTELHGRGEHFETFRCAEVYRFILGLLEQLAVNQPADLGHLGCDQGLVMPESGFHKFHDKYELFSCKFFVLVHSILLEGILSVEISILDAEIADEFVSSKGEVLHELINYKNK